MLYLYVMEKKSTAYFNQIWCVLVLVILCSVLLITGKNIVTSSYSISVNNSVSCCFSDIPLLVPLLCSCYF